MSRGVKNHKLKWIVLAGLLLVAVLGFLPSVDQVVQAQESVALRGWAWSSTIGWVSFNSDNTGAEGGSAYQVSLDVNQALVGYAWSSNIGWIHFDPAYTGVAGEGDNFGAKIVGSDELRGWARACSVFATGCSDESRSLSQTGGWDGWLKMTNVSITTETDGTRKLGGHAWGDLNLGWVGFAWEGFDDGVIIPPEGSVSCNVFPFSGDTITDFTFTAIGGGPSSIYTWTSDNGFGALGQPPTTKAFITTFPIAGTYRLAVSVDGSAPPAKCNSDVGVTVTACLPDGDPVDSTDPIIACCNPDLSDASDGICGPPSVCEITFNTDPLLKYYEAETQNYTADVKAQISITACGEEGLSLQANSELNSSFQLVCSLTPTVSGFTPGLCNSLDGGQIYWIWVNPTGDLPETSISKNLFDLILFKSGDNGLEETNRERVRFDYSVSGGT